MEFRTTSLTTRKRARGWESGALLMEYVVATGVASLLLAALAAILLYSVRNSVSLANYLDLNASSMRTLDTMSRDIRQCVALTSFSTNQLVFNDGTSPSNLVYTYSPSNRTLIRTLAGNANTLLTECDSMQFSIYQRTPVVGTYDQYPVATPTDCKVVAVKFTCSRSIMRRRMNTETVQEAKIVLRRR